MQLDSLKRPDGIAAVITVANIIYFIVAASIPQPDHYAGILKSQLLFWGSVVNLVLVLAAFFKRAWSAAVILLCFAALLFWVAAGA